MYDPDQLPKKPIWENHTSNGLYTIDKGLETPSNSEANAAEMFTDALDKVQLAVRDITEPLVYTDYTFFFPQNYRIQTGDVASAGMENPLVEFTYPFGHYGDPLLGLAMVWVYDCYPFVHTGFVEQFLWRRGISQREFAPRLGLKALQMVARDLPVARPAEGGEYWDRLRGWVEQALRWM